MNDNTIEYGMEGVHYALGTVASNGDITYDAPIAIPGGVGLTMDPKSEMTKFFADNRAYWVNPTSEGAEGELEMANFPDQFKIDCMGYVRDDKGGLAVPLMPKTKPFALIFQGDGDANKSRHCLFNVKAGALKEEYKTTEGKPAVVVQKIPIVVSGTKTGFMKVRYNEGEAGFTSILTTVPADITPGV